MQPFIIFSNFMTTLYLVRHGETVDNALQLMQGQTQGQLNKKGVKQAQQTSLIYKDTKIDVFMSSDLYRAIQTCELIAKPHHATIVTTPLLRERDWGDFTGRFIPDLKGLPFPENVESIDDLLNRATSFLTYVKQVCPHGSILAVGHGIINKAIQSVLYHKPMSEIKRMENTEVRKLEIV